MKEVLKKIALFLVIYLILTLAVDLLVPYHWGNPWYSTKVQQLQKLEKKQLPEVFFFGSSRIYRQVNPQVFDSSFASLSGKSLKSYNLGAPSTFCPQNYYLYENFLQSPLAANTRLVVMELMETDTLAEQMMHQERTNYWLSFPELSFALRAIFNDPGLSSATKYRSLQRYLTSYLEQVFHLGHFSEQLLDPDYYDPLYAGPQDNGYLSLETHLARTADEDIRTNYTQRRARLLEDPSDLRQRAVNSIKHHQVQETFNNHIHLQRILKMIEKSQAQDIHLVFLLAPRNSSPKLVNLLQQLPTQNRIDLSDANEFPQFYDPEYSFDIGHLNEEGARIFSRTLAEKLVEVQERP